MNQKLKDIICHYGLERMPVEGTYIASTYRATQKTSQGGPVSTAILGLYAPELDSVSCFHRLDFDEVWHFYGGDPLVLYLLYPDGTTRDVVMGSDFAQGEHIQFVVPAGVWQAGCTAEGGVYSLYGCTVAPGFVGGCFCAAVAEELIQRYPEKKDIIEKLSVNGEETAMPEGYCAD